MASVSWDSFLALLAPEVPGAPSISQRQALVASAEEWCARSRLWRMVTDTDTTAAGEADYALDISGARLEKVYVFEMEGQSLEEVGDAWQDIDATPGKPTAFAVLDDNLVRLFPTPDAAYSFRVSCAVKPARTATGIEKFLFDTYAEPIVSGAIYRLARIPGKEWSKPDLATFHKNVFESELARAVARDFVKTHAHSTPQFF